MKKKRAIYNLIMGIGSKTVLMVLGFLIPKIFIENYGSDINGLLTSIAQVFAYLSLVEAGVGVATTQALYKVVAADDWNEISAIMNAATKFYKKTGCMYLCGVICTAILYPLLVPNPLQFYQVFLIIVFSGLGDVFNYFFQSKYIALLNTEGKTYIHVAISTAITIVTQVLKIIMVSRAVNIVFIYFIYFLVSVTQIAILNVYIHKNYKKKLNKKMEPNISALSQHNSVLVHQISGLVFSNTDVLILTAFTNLKSVSIYTVYNMVVSNINVLVSTALDSFTSALGLVYNEDRKRFDRYYDLFELGSWMIYFVLMSVTLLLYEPFIKLYTAKADISYADVWLPLLFVLNQLLSLIRMPGLKIMNIEGCFKDTRTHTIIETVINLTVSLIAVQYLGIYGVLLGTTAALCYRTFDIIIYSNRKILHRKYSIMFRRLLVNVALMAFVQFLFRECVAKITTVMGFIKYGLAITILTSLLYLVGNFILELRNENMKILTEALLKKIKR